MTQFLIQELPILLLLATLAYAGIAWWFNQATRFRRALFAAIMLALWYGFNVAQYLAGHTFSDYAIRTAGSSFCYLLPVEACASRRAEEELKQARQTQDPWRAVEPRVAERIKAEFDRRKADAEKAKADANRKAKAERSIVVSPDAAQTGTIELPPITVSAPSRTVVASSRGDRFTLADSIYRLAPSINFTTTMYVALGSVILIKDGIVELECTAGNAFRVFTRGWSRFELVPGSSGTVVEVAELVQGNQISRRP